MDFRIHMDGNFFAYGKSDQQYEIGECRDGGWVLIIYGVRRSNAATFEECKVEAEEYDNGL
jgi:hypothetical protein